MNSKESLILNPQSKNQNFLQTSKTTLKCLLINSSNLITPLKETMKKNSGMAPLLKRRKLSLKETSNEFLNAENSELQDGCQNQLLNMMLIRNTGWLTNQKWTFHFLLFLPWFLLLQKHSTWLEVWMIFWTIKQHSVLETLESEKFLSTLSSPNTKWKRWKLCDWREVVTQVFTSMTKFTLLEGNIFLIECLKEMKSTLSMKTNGILLPKWASKENSQPLVCWILPLFTCLEDVREKKPTLMSLKSTILRPING